MKPTYRSGLAVGLAVVLAVAGCGGSTTTPADDAPADVPTTDTGSIDSGAGDTGTVDSGAPTDATTDSGATDAPSDTATETPTGTCITDKTAGTHSYTCASVKYDVVIPAACAAGGCGLILDVHGATMSAKMEDNNTAMRALGDKYGYVVIQPTAPGSPPTTSWTPGADDDKVYAVLVEAIAVLGIDKKRVHMTGFSQGGMMTSRFLCKHADLFGSVAPAAGTGCTFTGSDTPSVEVPVLYLHGTADILVAYSAGTKQRDAAIAAWKMTGPVTVASDAKYSHQRWTSPKGTVFEFFSHDYKASSIAIQGHCYPGSKDEKGGEPGQLFGFACTPPNAFVWGEAAMAFFIAHPRP